MRTLGAAKTAQSLPRHLCKDGPGHHPTQLFSVQAGAFNKHDAPLRITPPPDRQTRRPGPREHRELSSILAPVLTSETRRDAEALCRSRVPGAFCRPPGHRHVETHTHRGPHGSGGSGLHAVRSLFLRRRFSRPYSGRRSGRCPSRRGRTSRPTGQSASRFALVPGNCVFPACHATYAAGLRPRGSGSLLPCPRARLGHVIFEFSEPSESQGQVEKLQLRTRKNCVVRTPFPWTRRGIGRRTPEPSSSSEPADPLRTPGSACIPADLERWTSRSADRLGVVSS